MLVSLAAIGVGDGPAGKVVGSGSWVTWYRSTPQRSGFEI